MMTTKKKTMTSSAICTILVFCFFSLLDRAFLDITYGATQNLLGWPVTLAGVINESVTLADLNGDGSFEILVGGDDGKLYVLNANGTSFSSAWPATIGGTVNQPVVADLEGNGSLEIIATSSNGKIVIFNSAGAVLNAGWALESRELGTPLTAPAVGNVSGNSNLEIVAAGADGVIYGFNADGTKITSAWPIQDVANESSAVLRAPVLANLTGDSLLEIVASSLNGKIHVWNGDTTKPAGWPQSGVSSDASLVVANADADSALEIVAGSSDGKLRVFEANGTKTLELSAGGAIVGKAAVGDIDGDGMPEIAVGSQDGMVHAWNHDGTRVTGWPVQSDAQTAFEGDVTLADMDGNGDIEILIGNNDGKVYAFHHTGDRVANWPNATGSSVYGAPQVRDINQNGAVDIIVGSTDKKVYAWTAASGQCDIAASPTTISFGSCLAGRTCTATVTLSNAGGAACSVTGIAFSNPLFSLSTAISGNLTISPSSQTDLALKFQPTASGSGTQTSTLSFTSNDPDTSPLTISLTGEGISGPRIRFASDTLNHGSCNVGSECRSPISVYNDGSEDLRVTGIRHSNSSEFGNVNIEGELICRAPDAGQTTRQCDLATLIFRPAAGGARTGTVTVTSSDPTKPSVTLTENGTGTGVPDICLPPSLNFGSCQVGTTCRSPISVCNDGDGTLRITGISFSNRAYSNVNIEGDLVCAAGSGQCDFTILFTPPSNGTHSGIVTITCNDGDECPAPLNITGMGTGGGTPDIDFSTTNLQFGSCPVGTTCRSPISVFNRGNGVLRVTGLAPTGDFGNVNVEGELLCNPGQQCDFLLTFAPTAAGTRSDTVTVTSNDPDEGTIVLNVTGTGT